MTHSRRTAPALLLLAVVSAAGCGGRGEPAREVDRSLIQIEAEKLAILSGPVGESRWRRQATYALVVARNGSQDDLLITLAGELVGGSGASWPVRRESLRVPAGGTRLFALVDGEQAERPQATGARARVVGAVPVAYAPPFLVTDGRVVLDQERAVAAGYVVNTADRPGSVVVIGAFFDKEGVPLKRTSTLFALDAGRKRGVQLVGPPGSRSAYLFVGDVSY